MGTGSWWSVDCGVAYLSKASPAQNFPEHRGEAIHTRHRTTPRSRIPTFIPLHYYCIEFKRVDGDDFPAQCGSGIRG